MSTTIDNNVVEMRFNNSQFEAGVKSTLGSLDQLKKSLNLDGAGATSSLKNIEAGVNSISSRFTAMGAVAQAVLTNITSMAMNLGSKLVNSLAIDPIMQGFGEYETKIGSIQTVLANTAKHGTSVETINAEFKKLNDYADKTIYSFGDMTKNVGLFTNAGIKVEDATSMIKGFSNSAAAAGTDAGKAAEAARQLSQGLSAGRITLQDWNSLQTAGMGNENMKAGLIDIAGAMGTLQKAGLKTTMSTDEFRDSLKKGWVTSDVMSTYLRIMAGDMSEAEMASLGLTKAQVDGFVKQQKMAEDAATKVRTFTQLMGTLSEAVGSSWAETFEIIFGGFEGATDLFTGIKDAIDPIITEIADARNNMLREWADAGGRTDLFAGIGNIATGLISIFRAVGQAFGEIFPPMTGQRLAELSKGFREFTERIKPSETALENLKRTFKGIFAIFSIVKTLLTPVAMAIGLVFDALFTGSSMAAGGLLGFTTNIGDYLVGIDAMLKSTNLVKDAFNQLVTVFTTGNYAAGPFGPDSPIIAGALKILEVIEKVKRGVREFLDILSFGKSSGGPLGPDSPIAATALGIHNNLGKATTKLEEFQASLASIDSWKTFTSAAEQAWTVLAKGNFIGGVLQEDSPIISALFDMRKGFFEASSAAEQMWTVLAKGNFIGGVLQEDSPIISALFDMRKGFLSLKDLNFESVKSGFVGFINSIKQLDLNTVKSGLMSFGSGLASSLSQTSSKIPPMFNNLINAIRNWLGPAFQNLMSYAGERFSALGTSIQQGLSKAFAFVKANIGPAFSAMFGVIGTGLSQFGKFVSEQASKIDFAKVFDGLVKGLAVGGTGGMLVVIGKLIWDIAGFFKSLKGLVGGFSDNLDSIASAITGFDTKAKGIDIGNILKVAGALALLAASVFVLASIPPDELKKGLLGLGALMAMLGAFTIVMSYAVRPDDLLRVSTSVLLFSAAIMVLAVALKKLNDVDWSSIGKMAVVMVIVGAVASALGAQQKSFAKASASILLLSVALLAMVGVVALLGAIDPTALDQGMASLGLIMLMLLIFSRFAGVGLDKKAFAWIPGLAFGVAAISKVVTDLGSLDMEALTKGMVALGLILTMLALFMNSQSAGGADPIKLGVGLMALSASIMILSLAIKMLGSMPMADLAKGLLGVGLALTMITIAMNLMPADMAVKAMSMMGLAAAMVILSVALMMLGGMSIGEIALGLSALAGMMIILAFGLQSMQASLAGAAALIVVALAIGMLVPSLMLLGSMSLDQIVVSLIALAGVFGVLALAGLLLSPVAPTLLAVGVALILFGAAVLLASVGITILAVGLSMLAPVALTGAVALLALGAAAAVVGVAAPLLLAAGAGFLVFGIGLLIASVGVLAFGAGLVVLGAGLGMVAATAQAGVTALGLVASSMAGMLVHIVPMGIMSTTFATLGAAMVVMGAGAVLLGTGLLLLSLGLLTFSATSSLAALAMNLLTVSFSNAAGSVGAVDAINASLSTLLVIMPLLALAASLAGVGVMVFTLALNAFALAVGLSAAAFSLLGTAIESAGSKVATAMEIMSVAVSVGVSSITASMALLAPSVSQTADAVLTASRTMAEAFGNMGVNSAAAVVTGVVLIVAAMTPLSLEVDKTARLVVTAGDAMVKAFADMGSKSAAAINASSNQINSALASIASSTGAAAVAVGQAIISGMVRGMANSSAVTSAARSVALNALNSAKAALDSNSPSKEFMKLGADTVLGLALGIKDNTATATDEASAMGTSVVDTFAKTISDIEDYLSNNVDMNPTIKPVLDLDELRNGTKTIEGMFGRIPALDVSSGYAKAALTSMAMATPISGTGSSGSGSNVTTIEFKQYNTSPKALSRVEIYRQTQNQLAKLKGVVG